SMALDYKTRQAMATNEKQRADDYCPECGRPWFDPAPERPHRASCPWRAVLLAVVGVCVALTFGPRAARAHAFQAAAQRNVAALNLCLGGATQDSICPSLVDA